MADYEPIVARLNEARARIGEALAGIEALYRCAFCRCECYGCAPDSHNVERDPHCTVECFGCGCSGVTDMADAPPSAVIDPALLTRAARSVLETADAGGARTQAEVQALDALRAALAGNRGDGYGA